MKVIYYRRADGSIRSFHGSGKIPEEQLPERVAKYNAESKIDQAFVADLPEGSFEAYLFQKAQEHARLSRETLEDLRATLADADSLICDLISQAEGGSNA